MLAHRSEPSEATAASLAAVRAARAQDAVRLRAWRELKARRAEASQEPGAARPIR